MNDNLFDPFKEEKAETKENNINESIKEESNSQNDGTIIETSFLKADTINEVNAESNTIITSPEAIENENPDTGFSAVPPGDDNSENEGYTTDENNSYGQSNTSYNFSSNNEQFEKALNKKKKTPKGITTIAIIVAAVSIIAILATGIWGAYDLYNNDKGEPSSSNTVEQPQASSNDYVLKGDIPESGPLTVAQIYAKVKKSVVTVLVDNGSLGSGIIIEEDGTVITNNHVVESGKSYKIIDSDGKEYSDVKLLGADAQSDLAVLKINSTDKFSAAQFGKTSELVVGQPVVAIGNPYSLDLSFSCTNGVISGIRTNLTLGDFTSDLIQTNAQINPGNSGGPLIDEFGRVIGIINIKILGTGSTGTEGLGFAIPVDVAMPIIDSLMKNGYISKPVLGISGSYIDPMQAQIQSLPMGILIAEVTDGTDAQRKGLVAGDVITKINDKTFKSMAEFNSIKSKSKIGQTIKLTVYRDGKYIELNVTLVESKN